jgi:hypothetical protein
MLFPSKAPEREMQIDDQSMLWGLPVASWDKIGFGLLLFGAALGVLALFASLASSVILYRTGNITQAELRTKALTLESKAEELRNANLKLEEQIAPRRLDDAQRGALIFAMAPFAGKKVRLASYALDLEGAVLTKQIFEALQLAKGPRNWVANTPSLFFRPQTAKMRCAT